MTDHASLNPEQLQRLAKSNYSVGCSYIDENQLEKAQIHLEKAVELDPQFINAWNNLGSVYFNLGKILLAIECFKKAISIDFHSNTAYFNLIRIYLQTQQYTQASDVLNKYLEENNENKMASLLKALIFEAKGELNKAFQELTQNIETYGPDAELYNMLGNFADDLDKREQTIQFFKKAVELEPKNPDYYNNLGYALDLQGKFPQAETTYLQSIKLQDNDPVVWNNLANLYFKMEKFSEAHAAYQRALDNDPKYIDALNNKAQLYLEENKINPAKYLLQQALEIDPDNPYVLDCLGQVFEKDGDLEQAKQLYTKAYQILPEDAEIKSNFQRIAN